MFNVRNIIVGIIVLVLAVAIPVTVKLSQKPTQLKSKAAGCEQRRLADCSDSNVYCYCRGCHEQSGCRFENFSTGSDWSCVDTPQCSAGVVQYASPDCNQAINCPAGGGGGGPTPVTVSGKVINKVTNQGVQVTINQDRTNGCNIGTKQTNSSTGAYSFDNVTPTANTFCLSIPAVAGYKGIETTNGQSSYESLVSNSTSNGSNYNFLLIPDDNAQAASFQILDANNTDVTTGPIFINQPYIFKITMTNNGNSSWKKGVYKLQPTADTKSTWALQSSYDWISPSGDVTAGGQAIFSLNDGKAPANPSVGGPTTPFDVSMTNSQQNFGAGIQRLIQVRSGGGGGGGGTGVCTGSAGFIAGADRVWKCVDESNLETGCVGGSKDASRVCSGNLACFACATTPSKSTFPFGQCGICRNNPKTQTEDPRCEDPSASKEDGTCTTKHKITINDTSSKEFRDICIEAQCVAATRTRDCLVCFGGSNCQTDSDLCIDPAKPVCEATQPNRGFCKAQAGGGGTGTCPSTAPTTQVRMRKSGTTNPWVTGGLTIAIGESADVAGFHGNKAQTTDIATDITNIKGTGPSGNPASSTFDLSISANHVATFTPTLPGVYTITADTNQTGDKCQGSADITVSGAPAPTQCYKISENQADLNSFLSCNGISGQGNPGLLIGTSPTRVDFGLSSGNGTKTIHVRFLKIPQGTTTPLPDCTNIATCKEETATIDLVPVTPPASSCTNFHPVTSTRGNLSQSSVDAQFRPIHVLPDSGATSIIVTADRTPANSAITVTSTPALTSNNTDQVSGNAVIGIAANNSTTANADFVVSATIPGASTGQTTACNLIANSITSSSFILRVPPTQLSACLSTQAQFRILEASASASPVSNFSTAATVTITMGQKIQIVGFNDQTTTKSSIASFQVTDNTDFTSQPLTPDPATLFATFTPAHTGGFTITVTTSKTASGADCKPTQATPIAVVVNPAPTPTPSPVPAQNTLCFAFSENDKLAVEAVNTTDANSFCKTVANGGRVDNKLIFPYTDDARIFKDYIFKDQTPGIKTFFVKFIGLNGNLSVVSPTSLQKSIRFNPAPVITSAGCTQASSGVGTAITIKGNFFGTQGNGTVKLGNQEATIDSWDLATNAITAHVDQRVTGKNDVTVTVNDGRSAKLSCIINTSTVVFKTASQCKSAGSSAASNVDIKVFEAVAVTTQAVNPEPVLNQKISLNAAGEPQGFAPVFEKGKKYELIIKAPGSLAKRVDFNTANAGTINLNDGNPIVLPQGDIAPVNAPDGKINAFDKSLLISQWNLVTDVARTGDLNGDGRINSIDYACMRQNINAEDEKFSPLPAVTPTAVPSGTPTPTPTSAPGSTPTPIPTSGPTPTPIPTPTPSPVPSATPAAGIPFRLSFDANFSTIDGQGTGQNSHLE